MRRMIGIIALLGVVAAVFFVLREPSRSDLTATDFTTSTTRATVASAATADTPASIPQVTDTTRAEVATTSSAATTLPPDAAAAFAVTEIQFGEGGFIAITNVGTDTGNLAGYALCNRPRYFQIPDLELAPLEVAWIAVGDGAGLSEGAGIAAALIPMNGALGTLPPTDGELGLYRSSTFEDPDALVTYVEWGSSGHGRSEVAVAAGLWEEGAALEIPPDAFGIQSTALPPASPDDWVAGVGG